MMYKKMSIYPHPELNTAIKQTAKITGMSVNRLVIGIMQDFVKRFGLEVKEDVQDLPKGVIELGIKQGGDNNGLLTQ